MANKYDKILGEYREKDRQPVAEFDAVVASDGSGDYLALNEAWNAGKFYLYVKNGNYQMTSSVFMTPTQRFGIIGESRDGVVIDQNGCSVWIIDATPIEVGNVTVDITSGQVTITATDAWDFDQLDLTNKSYVLTSGDFYGNQLARIQGSDKYVDNLNIGTDEYNGADKTGEQLKLWEWNLQNMKNATFTVTANSNSVALDTIDEGDLSYIELDPNKSYNFVMSSAWDYPHIEIEKIYPTSILLKTPWPMPTVSNYGMIFEITRKPEFENFTITRSNLVGRDEFFMVMPLRDNSQYSGSVVDMYINNTLWFGTPSTDPSYFYSFYNLFFTNEDSGNLNGKYGAFKSVNGNPYYYWISTDGVGTDPELTGTAIQVDITTGDSFVAISEKVYNALIANTELTAEFNITWDSYWLVVLTAKEWGAGEAPIDGSEGLFSVQIQATGDERIKISPTYDAFGYKAYCGNSVFQKGQPYLPFGTTYYKCDFWEGWSSYKGTVFQECITYGSPYAQDSDSYINNQIVGGSLNNLANAINVTALGNVDPTQISTNNSVVPSFEKIDFKNLTGGLQMTMGLDTNSNPNLSFMYGGDLGGGGWYMDITVDGVSDFNTRVSRLDGYGDATFRWTNDVPVVFADENGDIITIDSDATDSKLTTLTKDLAIDCGTEKTIRLVQPVFQDLRLPLSRGQSAGVNVPTFAKIKDDGAGSTGVFGWHFASNLQKDLYINDEFGHDKKITGYFDVHIHWMPTTANAGDVVLQVELLWDDLDAVSGNTVLYTGTYPTNSTAYENIMSELVSLTEATKSISSQLSVRVSRLGNDGADTYPDDIIIRSVGIHYELDTLGSRQEYIK